MENIKIKKINNNKIPLELLLLADPSEESIEKYLKKSMCIAAYKGNEIVGACVLVLKNSDSLEIVNIVVAEDNQGRGVGRLLLLEVIKKARKEGRKKLVVGTGNSSISQLAFYQKCGFRMTRIKRDYFIKKYKRPIYENGIQCEDMIVLELKLWD